MKQLSELGLLRLHQIIGSDRHRCPALIPVSRSTWWAGVASRRFPQPTKIGRCTFWYADDIYTLIKKPDYDNTLPQNKNEKQNKENEVITDV